MIFFLPLPMFPPLVTLVKRERVGRWLLTQRNVLGLPVTTLQMADSTESVLSDPKGSESAPKQTL